MPDNWLGIELRHLRALRAIAAAGTFWAAAESLNTSQSTISDHIAALETLTGQRLIERARGRRTVQLTEAGRLLLGHAEAIEARLRAAEADFRALAAGRTGTLRVGIYQSIANKVLPEVMRRFRAQRPEVDIQLAEAMGDDELLSSVERGDLDLSFAIHPVPEGPFEVLELMRDPYVLIAAAGSELATHRPHVGDLQGVPMIGYYPGRTEEVPENFVLSHGVKPRIVFRSNDNGTVQGMVAAGLGVALAPLLAVDETDPKIALVELAEPMPPRVLVMVWHRERYRPPAWTAFVDVAAAVAREVAGAHEAFLAKRPR
jgi:molybdate transport repressor ModE-like protein